MIGYGGVSLSAAGVGGRESTHVGSDHCRQRDLCELNCLPKLGGHQ